MSAPAPQRLLFLNPSAEFGGAEVGLLNLVRSLDPGRFQPWVLLPGPGPLVRELEHAGARVRFLGLPPGLRRLSRGSSWAARLAAIPAAVSYLLRLRSALGEIAPTVLWTNGIKAHLFGVLAALGTGVRVVAHLRDPETPGILRRVLPWADLVVANSPYTARASGLPVERVMVMPNSVPIQEIRCQVGARTGTGEHVGLTPDMFVVLAVGALTEHKGQLRLLEAFAPLARERPEARLVLVGGEPYVTEGHGGMAARLRARAGELGIPDQLVLRGTVAPPWSDYAAADVFALPSRAEGFGRAYLEAAAFGLPVVATREGGTSDLFPDGEALLLDPFDRQEWADALRRLADDEGMRRSLGGRARRRARDFDIRLLPERLDAALARVLGGRR